MSQSSDVTVEDVCVDLLLQDLLLAAHLQYVALHVHLVQVIVDPAQRLHNDQLDRRAY